MPNYKENKERICFGLKKEEMFTLFLLCSENTPRSVLIEMFSFSDGYKIHRPTCLHAANKKNDRDK